MTTKINGTNTVASPAITGDDVDTGVVYGNAQVDISIGGASKATVDSNGRLGIGTTSPSGLLHLSGDTCQLHFTDEDDSASSRIYQSGATFAIDVDQADAKGSSVLKFRVDDADRMLINSSGNVGINSDGSGPDRLLYVSDSGAGSAVTPFRLTNVAGNVGTEVRMEFECGVDEVAYISAKNEGSDVGPLIFATASSTGAYPTEKMRIDPSGTLCINETSDHNTGEIISVSGSAHIMEIQNASTAGHRTITLRHARASGGTNAEQIVFEENGGGAVGSIQSNGSSTSYNTSSDYRLKENITAISDGITRLKTLKPSRFNFKADAETTVDGFLAHEVTAVPEAITGTKDQVATEDDIAYEKGDPIYQSIDQSKLVPLLTAALQEAIAKIETLETKVAALEAA